MKKPSFPGTAFVCAAVLVSFLSAGCDLFGKEDEVKTYDYLFTNDTSYTVSVQPDGQTGWTSFTLPAGTSKTVTIPDTTIRFKYNQANLILCDNSVGGKLRFYNRTLLMIRNSTTADLDFVEWRGYYFGEDLVWDAILGKYVYGLKPGSAYINEVSAGSGYVYFWFAAGGPKYRTTGFVSVAAEEQKTFTFLGTTTVVEASLAPRVGPASKTAAGETAGVSGMPSVLGVEVVPGTGDPERSREAETRDRSLREPVGAEIPREAAVPGDGEQVFAAQTGKGE
jgi:hypothetical protein